MKHSNPKTDWIAGRLAAEHLDIELRKLRAIVDDALRMGLVYDANSQGGRMDSADDRNGKGSRSDALRARQDESLAIIRDAHRTRRGLTKSTINGNQRA